MTSVIRTLIYPTRRVVEAEEVDIKDPIKDISNTSPALNVTDCRTDFTPKTLGCLKKDFGYRNSNIIYCKPSQKGNKLNGHVADNLTTAGIVADKDVASKVNNYSNTINENKIKRDISKHIKTLTNTNAAKDIQVINKTESQSQVRGEKRKLDICMNTSVENQVKKRKASPIIFGLNVNEEPGETLKNTGSHKPVAVPRATIPIKYAAKPTFSHQKLQLCLSFPACTYGARCAFLHPPCKFAATCSRRNCSYSHTGNKITPVIVPQRERTTQICRTFPACRYGVSCAYLHPPCRFAATCSRRNCSFSHAAKKIAAYCASSVATATNYKTVPRVTPAAICKFYPKCLSPTCRYTHPLPCQFGKNCINKIKCQYYHDDVSNSVYKWSSPKV